MLMLSYFASAQDLVFSPIEGRHQLNEEQIRNITQLPDGRLVVITEGMLNLFDGAGFRNIHIDDESTVSLSGYKGFHHSYIENGRLWLKNKGRLALISISKEHCEPAPMQVLNNLGFEEPPLDFFVDGNQNIWIITGSDRLLCHENRSGKTYSFAGNISFPQGARDIVYDIVQLNDCLYIFYRSGLMRCFDLVSRKELYREDFLKANKRDYRATLFVLPSGRFLYQIRNGSGGQLIRFDTKTKQTEVLLETNYWLNYLAAGEQENTWLASRDGLWYFSPGSPAGRFFPELQLIDGRTLSNEISTIFYDHQKGLWVGTLNQGLYYYHPDRFKFTTYGRSFFSMSPSEQLQVTSFEETPGGDLLIGTKDGLFTTRLPIDRSRSFRLVLPGIQCNATRKDEKGTIWIAASQGLFEQKPGEPVKRRLPYDTRFVYESPEGDLYICTGVKGLLRLNRQTDSFETIFSGEQLPGIKQITLWNRQLIGISEKGPFIIGHHHQSVSFPLQQGNNRSALFRHSNHQYTALLQDRKNLLWMGTYDGLNVWDDAGKRLYQLHTNDGLVNNSIKAIIEDRDHSIWVTTSRGISHIFIDSSGSGYQFRFVNYNSYDGVLEHTFSDRAAFLSAGSILLTGGVNGMNTYSTVNKAPGNQLLHPVLLSFKLAGSEIEKDKVYDGRTILHKSIADTDTLTLLYDQNFFSLGFSGLNYINPAKTFYRYKLEGIDRDWRIVKPQNGIGEAGYTNIPPGTYPFKVQAGADGITWPGAQRTIMLIIRPPFWNTIYAWALYAMMAMAAVWFVSRHMAKRNRRKREKEEAVAIEKARSEFMTNMSHELRTPLTLIITPIKALLAKVTDTHLRSDLARISNSADLLLDTVNQLLEFKKIDAGSEVLTLTYINNLSFINEICDAYSEIAIRKNIDFKKEVAQQDISVWIDKPKVTRIITNLLSNAFKFTADGGTVSISVKPQAAGVLHITVKDTGVGIAAVELQKVFDRFYQAGNRHDGNTGSGIGLYIVKQYAELHGGRVTVASVRGEGSCFDVLLSVKEPAEPIHQASTKQGGQTLLIVEDNTAFREYLARELRSGYTIITAKDGKEGLQKALECIPDIIITDMMMPEMPGPDFCRALRREIAISHTPVIMLTARTSDEARFEGYEAGADAYLVKPFDMNMLRLRIEKLLQLTEVRKQVFHQQKDIQADKITSNPIDQALLERALKCIHDNLSNPDYSVEKFSADMHMDRTGLYRKLMALTGHSPTNFIRSIRLKKAAGMILEKKMPVSDIAIEVGFNSVSYFTKCFHEQFGKPPSQYDGDSPKPKIKQQKM